jgi:prepilin-type N-terminal cleavage/methylation domain-containing protein
MNVVRNLRARRGATDDGGFTLPELVVTVVLIGIVMSGIASACIQALRIPAEGRARSLSANDRTYAATTMSDDIANSKDIKTLATGTDSTDPDSPNAFIVESKCSATPRNHDLLELTLSDGTVVQYRLAYTADATGSQLVELQRREGTGSWDGLVGGYCLGTEGVLDVLTITPGSDGEADPDSDEQPFYVGRRLRAQFHFRDTRTDAPTEVNVEGAPRTDCRPEADQSTRGPFDPELPNCEHDEA